MSILQGLIKNNRPIKIYFVLLLLILMGKALAGFRSGNLPDQIAEAIAEGATSVWKEDENIKSMSLFASKDGANKDRTVEIRELQANWGGLFSGAGLSSAGGNLYFNKFDHEGVTLDKGPVEFRLSNASTEKEKLIKIQVQGRLLVDKIEEPVLVELEFLSDPESYRVQRISGRVKIDEKITTVNL